MVINPDTGEPFMVVSFEKVNPALRIGTLLDYMSRRGISPIRKGEMKHTIGGVVNSMDVLNEITLDVEEGEMEEILQSDQVDENEVEDGN